MKDLSVIISPTAGVSVLHKYRVSASRGFPSRNILVLAHTPQPYEHVSTSRCLHILVNADEEVRTPANWPNELQAVFSCGGGRRCS